jgi:16S rRNA (adenine1518-N6/adenine1519-N6)-dimethyltransferase
MMQKTFPKKRFGQNFLKDKNIAWKIVRAIDAPHPRLVIEIGPGGGVLTEFAITEAENYLGVEIDQSLIEVLQSRFSGYSNFLLIEQDFLEFDLTKTLEKFPDHSRTVLGNIPFNITSPILFKLFEHSDLLDQAVLMVQKEVGNRIRANEGGKDMGCFPFLVNCLPRLAIYSMYRQDCFFPNPKWIQP